MFIKHMKLLVLEMPHIITVYEFKIILSLPKALPPAIMVGFISLRARRRYDTRHGVLTLFSLET